MNEFDKQYAERELRKLLDDIDIIDVSTFKMKIRNIASSADLRDDEDKTDYGFLRSNNK